VAVTATPEKPQLSAKERSRQAFAARVAKRAERDRAAAEAAKREVDAREQKIAALQKEIAERDERLERYKRDPIVTSAREGGDAESAIRSFVSETAPEKLIREQNERLAKLELELKERDRRAKEEQKKQEQAAVSASLDNAAGLMFQNADKFPYTASEWTPQDVRSYIQTIYDWSQKEGRVVQVEEVHDYLERCAKAVHDYRQARREKLLAAKIAPAPAPEKSANGRETRQAAPEKAKASGPQSSTSPVKRSKILTRDEQEAQDLALLKAAAAKDRAAMNGTSKVKS
jgi:hypothetical protein